MEEQHIENLRREYRHPVLLKSTLPKNPFDTFITWFNNAREANIQDPNAAVLATATQSGKPSARIILIKNVSENGFVFYTNYESKKGKELAENPQASLLFHWPEFDQQIRIEGTVSKTDEKTSKDYFCSRPQASQVAAWASRQSDVIDSREALDQAFVSMEAEMSEKAKGLPPFWGGYNLVPTEFEFWQGRESRLHDRIVYSLEAGDWVMRRLMP